MIKILFVCHGNICRSPMAEFVMKDLVQKAGCADEWEIASAAVSREEIGNPVHPGTRERLRRAAARYGRRQGDILDEIIIRCIGEDGELAEFEPAEFDC